MILQEIHDAQDGAIVLVWVLVVVPGLPSTTATYNDAEMANQALGHSPTMSGWLQLFVLENVPGGPQTVEVNDPTATQILANSISYTNVTQIGQVQSTVGDGTQFGDMVTLIHEVESQDGHLVAHMFYSEWGFTATPDYNQTLRWSDDFLNVMLLGDAPGKEVIDFTCNNAYDGPFVGIAVDLM